MFKKLSVILVLFVGLILISASGVYIWYTQASKPLSTQTATKRVDIKKGSSASLVAEILEKEKIIKSALAFKFYTQLSGQTKKLQSGVFELAPSFSYEKILQVMGAGPIEISVLIPEGMRREEMAGQIVKELEIANPTTAQNFVSEFIEESEGMEGYLFPATYFFLKETSASAVVARLRQTFDKQIASAGIAQRGKDLQDIVTLASIIERETRDSQKEGPVVAGILLKRVAAGWPIQADATLQYAAANVRCKTVSSCAAWWVPPTAAEKEVNSPFNTYKNLGLPPTPISSPGIAAIKAAANPEESEYWYYIHDNKGKIHYAVTLEEHNRNVNTYLR